MGSSEITYVVHGTTLVANTIIERKGAPTGVITTRGFRDTLEIGRELRYDLYDLFIERSQPLVERYLRREVTERVDSQGAVLEPLDLDQVREAAESLRGEGIKAIAVVFLHSYRNPIHEQQARELLRREFPEFEVTLSSDVSPEIREYERTSTTVANAYVKPLMKRYLERLDGQLREVGMSGNLYIMLSSGGITSVQVAQEFPIRLVESGPAGGAIGAGFYGQLVNEPDLMSFDMGGTTAKACLITGGEPRHVHEFEAARVRRFQRGSGMLLKVPVIDMIEIGAGGGSIAHVDQMGLLKVGPHSAGADPGPACYGRGGTRPTVTDADLLLGYFNPDYFLGGVMRLDQPAAEKAVREHVAGPLDVSLIEAAVGIHNVVNENMASAMRIHAAEAGIDPRRYALIAFGGAGPAHAYSLARRLKIGRIVCPLAAGTMSALGFLVAPSSFDLVQSYVSRLNHIDWPHLNAIYDDMEARGREMLTGAGVDRSQMAVLRLAEMRYSGQGYEITVPVPNGPLGNGSIETLRGNFNDTYRKLFERHLDDVPIEALTWRTVVTGPQPVIGLHFLMPRPSGDLEGIKSRRQVYFPDAGGFVDCPVYDRYSLREGKTFEGPAIVEERESTTVLGPGARARLDSYLNLLVDVEV